MRARAPPSAASVICCRCLAQLAILFLRAQFFFRAVSAKSKVRSNGLRPQSVFAAGGVVPVGFKHSWLSTKSLFAREAEPATVCDGDSIRVRARGARGGSEPGAVNLPHSVRMGTRVLETLDDMREILSYDSIGCKQALPIFEELVKAGQEPAGEDYPATNLEHSGWIAAKPPRTLRP